MSSDPALSVRALSKSYTIRHTGERHSTLGDAVVHRLKHPFERPDTETFLALDDVSFDVQRGQVLGVVGRNGAGKSTLLKVLSRITAPTTGEVDLYGRVGSLLEVGTGFHPELTGRENVYLNGSILGMRRREIDACFGDIVEFAGVERFLDTPVKRFSSGMFVRLAFAVAAHLRCDVLLVDEVLSVGDADFQARSLEKMDDVASSGRAVLFVSHQLSAIRSLCDSALVLDAGRVVGHGPVDEVVSAYETSFLTATAAEASPRRASRRGLVLASATPRRASVDSGEDLVVDLCIANPRRIPFPSVYLACVVRTARGTEVLQCDSRLVGETFSIDDDLDVAFTLRAAWLHPGVHTIDFFICGGGVIDTAERACSFLVSSSLPFPVAATEDAWQYGTVFAPFSFGGEPRPLVDRSPRA